MSTVTLYEFIEGAAIKSLSAVETDPVTSNQHEFNGVKALIELLGVPEGKVYFDATFVFVDDDLEPVPTRGRLSWYDSREAHPTRSELRLYYTKNECIVQASQGDTLIIAKLRKKNELLVVVAKAGSNVEAQLKWIFGYSNIELNVFQLFGGELLRDVQLAYPAKKLLDLLGVDLYPFERNAEELVISKFGDGFPTTDEFSSFAREHVNADPLGNPDQTILDWMDTEERLFRALERHFVEARLGAGFGSADELLEFSLSLHQRRRSRAGKALENHLSTVFDTHSIYYDRGKTTEGSSKPDFIFPSIAAYRQPAFSGDGLTMLGAKATCKDRWRQILREADRVVQKHLFTLEAPISLSQTSEMKRAQVVLVIPSPLHQAFKSDQQDVLMSLAAFIGLLQQREESFAGFAMGFGNSSEVPPIP